MNFSSKIILPQIYSLNNANTNYISICKILYTMSTFFKSMIDDKPEDKPHDKSTNVSLVYFYNFNSLLMVFKDLDNDLTNFNNNITLTQIIILTVNEGTEFNYPNTNYIKTFFSFINKWSIKLVPVSHYTHYNITRYINLLDIKCKMDILPHGIDRTLYRPSPNTNQAIINIPGFKFLFVGSNSPRKNLQLLIECFFDEFFNDPDNNVKLLILTDKDVFKTIHTKIVYITEIPELILTDIYRSVNCLVLPTKCEGFGLPVMEALACGTPVIAPYHSGIKTICDIEDIIPLDYTEEIIKPEFRNKISNGGGIWYNISKKELMAKMRIAYNNRDNINNNNLVISNKISQRFDLVRTYSEFFFNDIGPFCKYYIENEYLNYNHIEKRIGDNILGNRSSSYLKIFRYLENLGKHEYSIATTSIDNNIFNKFFNYYSGKCDCIKDSLIIPNIYDLIYLEYPIIDFNNLHELAKKIYNIFINLVSNMKKDTLIAIDHNIKIDNKPIGAGMYVVEYLNKINKPLYIDEYIICYKL